MRASDLQRDAKKGKEVSAEEEAGLNLGTAKPKLPISGSTIPSPNTKHTHPQPQMINIPYERAYLLGTMLHVPGLGVFNFEGRAVWG